MNVIGLTGANMRAMADVAELLLAAVSGSAHQVAIMLYLDHADQVRALRTNQLGVTEIWRVGADPGRAYFDHLVDAFVDDGATLASDVAGQLARFLHHVTERRAALAALPLNPA